MDRELIQKQCLSEIDNCKCLLALLATGVGKTKVAIDCINKICKKASNENTTVLIIIHRKVHKQNWLDDITKWGGLHTDKIIFSCYESLHKYANKQFDAIVLDECHHLCSEKRMDAMKHIKIKHNLIALSATVPPILKQWFRYMYNTKIVSCSTQEAIESNILPDPQILLVPLVLNNTNASETYEINKKAIGDPVFDEYKNLWVHKRNKVHAFIRCTQKQYVDELNGLISFYKRKAAGNIVMKNLWLRTCCDRLVYLANAKNRQVNMILNHLTNYRTVTFCASIEQTEVLGKNNIHSKNKSSQETLNKFNTKKIKHITACNMLNEGLNLTDCKYGIFANINASETIQIQRVGRSLRHKSPVLIIPFFKNTREEEIVKKWMENYNKDLIRVIHYLHEI